VLAGMPYRTAFARLVFVLAGGSGVIGIIVALLERVWKLGVGGWLLLCVAGMAAAIAVMLDEYFESRRQAGN